MKKGAFLAVAILACFQLFAQVTYSVTVPPGTRACFIAGEMTGWKQVAMAKKGDNEFTIHIPDAKASHQYKYCSGPLWNFSEVIAANRTHRDHDQVGSWTALWDGTNNFPPDVLSGKIQRVYFNSRLVDDRFVDIWLPEGYSAGQQYDVLYMHDGQMLFDAKATWNRKEWNVDSIAGKLIREKKIRPVIIVGIHNNGNKRHQEFFPEEAIGLIAQPSRAELEGFFSGNIRADSYLRFIVTELKPYIDSAYSTLRQKENTSIAGSSMGGLISLYAFCEYPDVFGNAACISTHWPGVLKDNDEIPDAFVGYVRNNLPLPSGRRLYFDYGTAGLDASYARHQKKVDEVVNAKGYTQQNTKSLAFVGATHDENAWQARLDCILLFMLGE